MNTVITFSAVYSDGCSCTPCREARARLAKHERQQKRERAR